MSVAFGFAGPCLYGPAVRPPVGALRLTQRTERDTDNASWDRLSEPVQLALSRAALRRAAETIARQAETLAAEMAEGGLADRGGPDALRLFAAVLRVTSAESLSQHAAA